MSIPGATTPLLLRTAAASPTISNVERSLYFDSTDGGYLYKAFASAGDRKTFTFSTWVKRAVLSTNQYVWSVAQGTTLQPRGYLRFDSTANQIIVAFNPTGSLFYTLTSAASFRDPNAWMHILLAVDTTQATEADRTKLYVNNVLQTFSGSYIPQNTDTPFNNTWTHSIGRNQQNGSEFLQATLADIYFIDGQALTPSSFITTDATTERLEPKVYSGTYGTNGYRLSFSDPTSTTTIAADSSGNSNNWTATSFPTASGVPIASTVNSPSSYGTGSAGGDVRGTYASLNGLHTLTTFTDIRRAQSRYTSTTAGATGLANIGVSSGKWYWEIITSAGTTETQVGVHTGSTPSATYSLAANNTTYGIRFDASAGTLDYTSNGTSWTSIDTGLTSGPYFPYFRNNGTTSKIVDINFGQKAWVYSAPSGYVALCDTNLPTPTITKSSSAVSSVIYTGTGAALTPTSSLLFSPDLVWIKSRGSTTAHALYDTVRGAQSSLNTVDTTAQVTSDNGVTSFDSNGFTLGTSATVNTSATSYASWCWDKNVTSGFDIVSYTGNGTNRTIAHSLGVKPALIIVKQRTATPSGTGWYVWHTKMSAANYLLVNSTAAQTAGSTVWNSTQPSTTDFSLGTNSGVNNNGSDYIAYLWSAVSGFSEFGSYVGTGGSPGRFIPCNFKPGLLLIKRLSATQNWVIVDNVRDPYNPVAKPLYPNLIDVEGSYSTVDFISDGFQARGGATDINASGSTYVFAAWAQNPFKYARAY